MKNRTLIFFKKNWGNLLFIIILIILIVPPTRRPIQVFVNRIFSFDPDLIDGEKQKITNYQWTLKSLSEENINFSDSKGQVVFINFWATWCAPCIAEMPNLQLLYDEYKNRVDFYFVTNDDPEKIKKFKTENNYTFPVFIPISKYPKVLKVEVLPTTYLLDKSGLVMMKELGVANWNSAFMRKTLDDLLAQ